MSNKSPKSQTKECCCGQLVNTTSLPAHRSSQTHIKNLQEARKNPNERYRQCLQNIIDSLFQLHITSTQPILDLLQKYINKLKELNDHAKGKYLFIYEEIHFFLTEATKMLNITGTEKIDPKCVTKLIDNYVQICGKYSNFFKNVNEMRSVIENDSSEEKQTLIKLCSTEKKIQSTNNLNVKKQEDKKLVVHEKTHPTNPQTNNDLHGIEEHSKRPKNLKAEYDESTSTISFTELSPTDSQKTMDNRVLRMHAKYADLFAKVELPKDEQLWEKKEFKEEMRTILIKKGFKYEGKMYVV